MLKHLDLFSGIGGFALACQWNGIETIGFVEIDKYCQKVLKKHWPDVPIVEDIRDVEQIKELATGNSAILATAGFPCQPFSVAGKREGEADDRYLWPETLAVIETVKPKWVLLENVAGIIPMALDIVLSDLDSQGYSWETLIIPACAVNAPHRRDRVWVVAHPSDGRHRWEERRSHRETETVSLEYKSADGTTWRACRTSEIRTARERLVPWIDDVAFTEGGEPWQPPQSEGRQNTSRGSQEVALADSNEQGLEGSKEARDTRGEGQGREKQPTGFNRISEWWSIEPELGRVAHGIPSRVDRLKCLGNAIVPQVAYEIIRVIKNVANSTI